MRSKTDRLLRLTNETTLWLAVIASWLSPYPWYVDAAITAGVSFWFHVVAAINDES